MSTLPHPIKWPGGKRYLSGRFWDIAAPLVPNLVTVVEPYCGGCAFTLEGLAREYPLSFVVNDLSKDLSNFWAVLQDEEMFARFIRKVQAIPFSEREYEAAELATNIDWGLAPWEHAAHFFVRCRQSLAGRMKGFAALTKTRTRRAMNEQVSAWLTAVDGLPEVHAHLRKVLILNRPALKVIREFDHEKTLYMVDPPYPHCSRKSTTEYGAFEMTDADHIEMLNTLGDSKAKWMLCGYDNALYESFFKDFPHTRHTFDLPNNASGSKKKDREIEVCWVNF